MRATRGTKPGASGVNDSMNFDAFWDCLGSSCITYRTRTLVSRPIIGSLLGRCYRAVAPRLAMAAFISSMETTRLGLPNMPLSAVTERVAGTSSKRPGCDSHLANRKETAAHIWTVEEPANRGHEPSAQVLGSFAGNSAERTAQVTVLKSIF